MRVQQQQQLQQQQHQQQEQKLQSTAARPRRKTVYSAEGSYAKFSTSSTPSSVSEKTLKTFGPKFMGPRANNNPATPSSTTRTAIANVYTRGQLVAQV